MNNPNLVRRYRPKNVILGIGMALAVLLPFGFSFLVRYLGDGNFNDRVIYSVLTNWGIVVILYLYAYKVENSPLLIWTGKNSGVGFTIISVLGLYVLYVLAAVVSSIPWWFGYRETDALLREVMRSLRGHTVAILLISVTAGVTEELIFRGYLLTRLSIYFKDPYVPVILSSAIFSALHYRYHSLGEFIFTFLLGTIFSVYYILYRNIHALIITHFLINFVVLNSARNSFY